MESRKDPRRDRRDSDNSTRERTDINSERRRSSSDRQDSRERQSSRERRRSSRDRQDSRERQSSRERRRSSVERQYNRERQYSRERRRSSGERQYNRERKDNRATGDDKSQKSEKENADRDYKSRKGKEKLEEIRSNNKDRTERQESGRDDCRDRESGDRKFDERHAEYDRRYSRNRTDSRDSSGERNSYSRGKRSGSRQKHRYESERTCDDKQPKYDRRDSRNDNRDSSNSSGERYSYVRNRRRVSRERSFSRERPVSSPVRSEREKTGKKHDSRNTGDNSYTRDGHMSDRDCGDSNGRRGDTGRQRPDRGHDYSDRRERRPGQKSGDLQEKHNNKDRIIPNRDSNTSRDQEKITNEKGERNDRRKDDYSAGGRRGDHIPNRGPRGGKKGLSNQRGRGRGGTYQGGDRPAEGHPPEYPPQYFPYNVPPPTPPNAFIRFPPGVPPQPNIVPGFYAPAPPFGHHQYRAMYPPMQNPPSLLGIPTQPYPGSGPLDRIKSEVNVSRSYYKTRDNKQPTNTANRDKKGQGKTKADRGKDPNTNGDDNKQGGKKKDTIADDTTKEANEEAKLICDVFDYMVKNFKGSGSPEVIRRESGLFPTDFDAADWFKKKMQFAALGKDGKITTVNVCRKEIQYCHDYIKKSVCENSKCKKFHLCKDFLCGYCCFGDKCTFSHNARDGRNIIAAQRYRLGTFSNEEIVRVLELRYPHVCQRWAKSGSCPDNMCFDLHICPGYINGQCREENCPKCHDRMSEHNGPIVTAYEMNIWNDQNFRKAVYLLREKEAIETAEDNDYIPEDDHDDPSMEPNEEAKLIREVFQFIVTTFDGSGSPEDIRRESGLFPTDFDVADWFKKKKQFAALEKDGKITAVNVCRKDISYCFDYIKRTGCAKNKCKRFHICKDFLCGYCFFGEKCNFSHNATDGQNIIAARRYGLAKFSNEEITCILRRRYPHVCQEWDKSGSCPDNMCFDLHICPGYINGQCHEENCPKCHDRMSEHNGPIVTAYDMVTWNEPFFRKAVYLVREREVVAAIEDKGDLLKTDIAGQKSICTSYLLDACKKRGCKQIHSSLPYIWQVKLWDEWKTISCQETVEELFSKPEKTATNPIAYNELTGDCRSATFSVVFEPLHATSVGPNGETTSYEVRRLSTKSYAFGKVQNSESFRTEWRWYLEFTRGEWLLMEPDSLQLTVETKFLAKQDTYLYTRENFKFKYQLNIDGMEQMNLTTQVSRNVQRRPLFVSGNDVKQQIGPAKLQTTPSVKVDLPRGWVPWDYFQQFEWVKLDPTDEDYKLVSDNFNKTLDANKQIIDDIYRVQNHVLWSTFCNHLETVMKPKKVRLGDCSPVTQLNLYHGTDNLEAVRGISINNFDSRTSGKNMTRFGDGAYFATDAKYSHEYTKGPHRFTFQAKVLVGEATEGKPEYRRPPSRPGMDHELYDSCVDVLKNPRIYVLFEKAQCYPEFLIHYHNVGDLKNTPDQDATELTSCCLL